MHHIASTREPPEREHVERIPDGRTACHVEGAVPSPSSLDPRLQRASGRSRAHDGDGVSGGDRGLRQLADVDRDAVVDRLGHDQDVERSIRGRAPRLVLPPPIRVQPLQLLRSMPNDPSNASNSSRYRWLSSFFS